MRLFLKKTVVPKVSQEYKHKKSKDILHNTGKSRNLGGYVLIGAGIYFHRKNQKKFVINCFYR